MISKFNSTCRTCGDSIRRGEQIVWSRATGAMHAGCSSEDGDAHDEDDSAGLERGTLASDRRLARNGLTVVRFSSGETMTRNSRGRCEDAPCCGCCS